MAPGGFASARTPIPASFSGSPRALCHLQGAVAADRVASRERASCPRRHPRPIEQPVKIPPLLLPPIDRLFRPLSEPRKVGVASLSQTAPHCPRKVSGRRKSNSKSGGPEGIRTPDLLNAIQTRSQLRHGPTPSEAMIPAVPCRAGSSRRSVMECGRTRSSAAPRRRCHLAARGRSCPRSSSTASSGCTRRPIGSPASRLVRRRP